MVTIKNISIPTPCFQQWNQMNLVNQGRHCTECCKTVIDFTQMSKDEIIGYMAASNNICGRFSSNQLANINTITYTKTIQGQGRFKRWILAFGIVCSAFFLKVNAQIKQAVAQIAIDTPKNQYKNSFPLGKILITSQQKTAMEISGRVTDSQQQPIRGASVIVKGTKIITTTDVNGYFKLSLPLSNETIIVRSLGYLQKETTINTAEKLVYDVKLEENRIVMGEVLINPLH